MFESIRIISVFKTQIISELLPLYNIPFEVVMLLIAIISNIYLFNFLRLPWPTLGTSILRLLSRSLPVTAESQQRRVLNPVSASRRPAIPQLRRKHVAPRIIHTGEGYVIGLETEPSGTPLEKPYRVGTLIENGEIHWLPAKNYQLLGQAVAAGEAFALTPD